MDPRIWIRKSVVWNRGSGSVRKCHGLTTLCNRTLIFTHFCASSFSFSSSCPFWLSSDSRCVPGGPEPKNKYDYTPKGGQRKFFLLCRKSGSRIRKETRKPGIGDPNVVVSRYESFPFNTKVCKFVKNQRFPS